jgi:hypothetical protein
MAISGVHGSGVEAEGACWRYGGGGEALKDLG